MYSENRLMSRARTYGYRLVSSVSESGAVRLGRVDILGRFALTRQGSFYSGGDSPGLDILTWLRMSCSASRIKSVISACASIAAFLRARYS